MTNIIYTELNPYHSTFSVEESKITISTHDWIDKPINNQAFHYKTHELFYPNLGDGWYSLTDTAENIINLISRQGRPWCKLHCAELVSSIRNNDNFKQTNLIEKNIQKIINLINNKIRKGLSILPILKP